MTLLAALTNTRPNPCDSNSRFWEIETLLPPRRIYDNAVLPGLLQTARPAHNRLTNHRTTLPTLLPFFWPKGPGPPTFALAPGSFHNRVRVGGVPRIADKGARTASCQAYKKEPGAKAPGSQLLLFRFAVVTAGR